MRQTHTYVTMPVTLAVYEEVLSKLMSAGYDHALHPQDDGSYLLDMHGIALELEPEASRESTSPWQPIATLPDHVPEDDDLILAATDDGRRMIWRIVLLKHQLAHTAKGKQPTHLQFPATRWMRLPPL